MSLSVPTHGLSYDPVDWDCLHSSCPEGGLLHTVMRKWADVMKLLLYIHQLYTSDRKHCW